MLEYAGLVFPLHLICGANVQRRETKLVPDMFLEILSENGGYDKSFSLLQ